MKNETNGTSHAFGDVLTAAQLGPHTITLLDADDAPNPASTKTRIWGAGRVRYTYNAGSLHAEIVDGCIVR